MKKVVLMSWPQLRHGEQTSLKPIVNFVHIIPETRMTGLGREPNNLIQSLQNQHFCFMFWRKGTIFLNLNRKHSVPEEEADTL